MRYLEDVLAPLLLAAEKYAQLTNKRETFNVLQSGHIGSISLAQKEAADALLSAALKYAKWTAEK